MKKNSVLLLMLILAVFGLVLSIYLVQHHYTLSEEPAFCDMSSTVSCSLVNQSSYAELFHVPVAFYGVLWFLLFIAILFFVYRKKELAKKVLVLWTGSGFLFVLYLLYAEYKVGALCPWCTLVHIDIFVLLALTLYLYRKKV